MEIKQKSESGQVIVILAAALIALLGFTSLAIDVGMIYSDRRYAQNAADASALAGIQIAQDILEDADSCPTGDCVVPTNWNPVYITGYNGGVLISNALTIATAADSAADAAIALALDNGYTLTDDSTEPSYIDNHKIVIEYNSGLTSTGAPFAYLEVRTYITSSPKTSFAHLFYSGPIKNSVIGVARYYLRKSINYGKGVVAFDPDEGCASNAIKELRFAGTGADSISRVVGGGYHTNSCVGFEGNVIVEGEGLTYRIATSAYPSTVVPPPVKIDMLIPVLDIPVTCPTTSKGLLSDSPKALEANNADGYHHIQEGIYTGLNISKSKVWMDKGVYCFEGNFDFSGIELISDGLDSTDGVTIYMMTGNLTINGGIVRLYSPDEGEYPNLLINFKAGNKGNITLIGNADTRLSGTVYLPGIDPTKAGDSCKDGIECIIYISGTSAEVTELNTSILGWNVNLMGNGVLNILFDNNKTFTIPGYSDMQE